jgi:hypothetical protein
MAFVYLGGLVAGEVYSACDVACVGSLGLVEKTPFDQQSHDIAALVLV